jgi:hypothetical protein
VANVARDVDEKIQVTVDGMEVLVYHVVPAAGETFWLDSAPNLAWC